VATLTSLSASVLLKLGLPSTDGMMTSAALTEAVNNAIQQISTDHEWPWLYIEDNFVTVAGTTSYNMPTSNIMLKWLGYKDDMLDMVQRQDIVRVSQIQGRPVIYAEKGNNIILGPTPDGDYTIDRGYYQRETPLVAGSDAPLLPDEYADYAVTVAAKTACVRLGDSERYNMLLKEEKMWVDRISDEVRTSMQTIHVKTRSDWWMGA
jgi:hypothetical protein